MFEKGNKIPVNVSTSDGQETGLNEENNFSCSEVFLQFSKIFQKNLAKYVIYSNDKFVKKKENKKIKL